MTSFRRPFLAIAVGLMLAPLSSELQLATTGASNAGVELVRGRKPTYPPCGWAKPGRTCYGGPAGGLYTAPGHRGRRWR